MSSKTKTLTESGLLLAVSLVLYYLGILLPGVGVYFRYLIPGLMAILMKRHDLLTLFLFSFALAFCVGLFFGLERLVEVLFMIIPAGFILPFLYAYNTAKVKIIAVIIFTFSGFFLLFFLGKVMGLEGLGIVDVFAIGHYSVYGRFYQKYGVKEVDFRQTVNSLIWLLVPIFSNLYGYVLYLINKLTYQKGLKILDVQK